jgi:hypothetical protein
MTTSLVPERSDWTSSNRVPVATGHKCNQLPRQAFAEASHERILASGRGLEAALHQPVQDR